MRLFILLLALTGFAFAQGPTEIPAPKKAPENFHKTYQLYFKDKVHKVKKVEYMDGTPIQHDLSPDGETLYLLEYKKRGRVKIFTEDEQGKAKVIERSPCFIDPVIES